MERYDSYQTCAEIRESFRMDAARKGKQCPGGYWIAKDKKCGKGGKSGGLKTPDADMKKRLRRRTGIAVGATLGGIAAANLAGGAAVAAHMRGLKTKSTPIEDYLGRTEQSLEKGPTPEQRKQIANKLGISEADVDKGISKIREGVSKGREYLKGY